MLEAKRKSVVAEIKSVAVKFERQFEDRFEAIARDPKTLSLAAAGLNFFANTRLQLAALESELASFKARTRSRS